MSMFGPKLGTWKVNSISDPRWDKEGRGYGSVSAGGPKEMWKWINECKEKYGEPPEDATMSFHKD